MLNDAHCFPNYKSNTTKHVISTLPDKELKDLLNNLYDTVHPSTQSG